MLLPLSPDAISPLGQARGGAIPTACLVKTSALNSFNSGAVTTQTLTGDGWIQCIPASNNLYLRGFSFTTDATCSSISDIGDQYSVRISQTGVVSALSGGSGVGVGSAPYDSGDILRLERVSGVVTVSKNGVVFHTFGATSSATYRFKVFLYTGLGRLENISINNGTTAAPSWTCQTNATAC
jgi:hypothetical protein